MSTNALLLLLIPPDTVQAVKAIMMLSKVSVQDHGTVVVLPASPKDEFEPTVLPAITITKALVKNFVWKSPNSKTSRPATSVLKKLVIFPAVMN